MFFVTAAACGTLGPANAHIVAEEPWHPAAAAYRTMLFLGNLEPVAWDLISEAYDRKHPAAAVDQPARLFFEPSRARRVDQLPKPSRAKIDRHFMPPRRGPCRSSCARL